MNDTHWAAACTIGARLNFFGGEYFLPSASIVHGRKSASSATSGRMRTTLPSFTRCSSSADTFRAYIWLAWYGTIDGTFTGPITATPASVTVSPARVSSQFGGYAV